MGGGSVEDNPAGHGMAVVGDTTIFLSHLAMFDAPHDYQVILEASFGPADAVYRADRTTNPRTLLYTFAPERFVLTQLFPGKTGKNPALRTFTGALVRNHFEEPPAHPEKAVEIASDVVVDVVTVVHQHKFDPHGEVPEHLTYLLFGKGTELFLAHRITRAPDFDQLVMVVIKGVDVSDDLLRHGVDITVTGRPNAHGDRIREGETVTANARIDGREVPVEIDAEVEVYDETHDFT